VTSFRMHRMHF